MSQSEAPYFSHRACYVNFAEHLQNHWNVNLLYPGAPNRWTPDDWRGFLTMIRAFGFNCFEYWLVPTLYDRPALEGGEVAAQFAQGEAERCRGVDAHGNQSGSGRRAGGGTDSREQGQARSPLKTTVGAPAA